jgi:nucleoside-diphosphate-sugar epimerase
MNSIILTGSSGFLGSRILMKILSCTNYGLILTYRNSKLNKSLVNSERINYVQQDDLIEFCEKFNYEIFGAIHSATEYGRTGDEIDKVVKSNLILPVNILNVLLKNKSKFFINTESFFNKDTNSYPYLLDYSSSKRALQYWLNDRADNMVIVNLYLEHIYGSGDSQNKFIPKLISDLKEMSEVPIYLSKGEQIRDFLHVDDAAQSFLCAVDFALNQTMGIYDFEIGTGVGTSLFDLSNNIKYSMKSNREINFGAMEYRKNEIMKSIANVSNNSNLNWKSETDLGTGILRLLSNE